MSSVVRRNSWCCNGPARYHTDAHDRHVLLSQEVTIYRFINDIIIVIIIIFIIIIINSLSTDTTDTTDTHSTSTWPLNSMFAKPHICISDVLVLVF